jgi:hypothetical protein
MSALCLGEPIPSTKQEYLYLLIRKSKEGKFPSVKKLSSEFVHESEAVSVCRYREGDRACTIGLLIPDARYHEEMEGRQVGNLVKDFRLQLPDWLSPLEASQLQYAHDSQAKENSWDHETFLDSLRGIRTFSDCVFPE